MNIRIGLILSTLLTLVVASTAQEQPKPLPAAQPEADANAVETRVYDIRDFLRSYEDYPLTKSAILPPTKLGLHAFNVRPTSAPSAPEVRSREEMVEQLTKLIIETIDVDSWKEYGGKLGSLKELSGQLVVTQTPRNHVLLQQLMSQLRDSQLAMITVVARWAALPAGDIDKYTRPLSQRGSAAAVLSVDVAALEKDAAGAIKYRGQITCFNGQIVHIGAGRARTVVHGLASQVGQGAAGYDPQAMVIQDGLSLEVTPILPPESRTAVIDIKNVVSDWNDIKPAPNAPSKEPINMDAPSTIDRVDLQVQQLCTTLSAPVGIPILVGGLTQPHSSDKADDGKQLYLIIEIVGTPKK